MTGSGKTLAFVVPVVETLLRNPCKLKTDIGAIIISPTRELATQTHGVVAEFVEACGGAVSLLLLTGGGTLAADIDRYKADGGNIIVATPGRLLEMFNRCGIVRSGRC